MTVDNTVQRKLRDLQQLHRDEARIIEDIIHLLKGNNVHVDIGNYQIIDHGPRR